MQRGSIQECLECAYYDYFGCSRALSYVPITPTWYEGQNSRLEKLVDLLIGALQGFGIQIPSHNFEFSSTETHLGFFQILDKQSIRQTEDQSAEKASNESPPFSCCVPPLKKTSARTEVAC